MALWRSVEPVNDLPRQMKIMHDTRYPPPTKARILSEADDDRALAPLPTAAK
jgi:hypothetical protein